MRAIVLSLGATIVAAMGVVWLARSIPEPEKSGAGRTLVTTLRSDPRTFNPLVGRDNASDLLASLTHATLVRINRQTDAVEPWLADRWEIEPDGSTYTLHLRRGTAFCDGTPLTADDVAFSFRAVYDEQVGSVLADPLRVGGHPLKVTVVDSSTVQLSFPEGYAPSLRSLDMLPILSKRHLGAALESGTLRDAWGLASKPADLCGAGPFIIQEYIPAQRVVLVRNPHFWLRDERGTQLPYLDRIVVEIVPDQNVEILRLETGQVDLISSELRPEDYAAVKRVADEDRLRLLNVGPGLDADFLWFNLKPGAVPGRRPWMQRVELRHAVSHAIDRQTFANTVFLGQGEPVYGPITPGNRRWYAPDIPHYEYDRARARQLLRELGLEDRNGDGWLDDPSGARATFSLLTQKGHTIRERAVAVIQEDLRQVGLEVNVVPLEFGALVERITKNDYEAVYLGLRATDTDPAANLDFWLSSGAFHFWNPAQVAPATDWERQIDELMIRQAGVRDDERKALIDQVQRIFAEHAPALYFAAPRLVLAVKPRVLNVQPSGIAPHILWNAEQLAVRSASGS